MRPARTWAMTSFTPPPPRALQAGRQTGGGTAVGWLLRAGRVGQCEQPPAPPAEHRQARAAKASSRLVVQPALRLLDEVGPGVAQALHVGAAVLVQAAGGAQHSRAASAS